MTLEEFNNLSNEEAEKELTRCCGSSAWAQSMTLARPFLSLDDIDEKSKAAESKLSSEDWLEAFTHHPRIGDVDQLREKFATTASWSEGEQKSVSTASEETLSELKRLNDLYYDKNGFIFIVCATGKSSSEMLEILQSRIDHPRDKEITIAANEQKKITRIRLEKLFA